MNFQVLFNHECYASHTLWTLYGKRLVSYAYRAEELRRRRYTGEDEHLGDYRVPIGCTEGVEDYGAEECADDPNVHLRVSVKTTSVDPRKDAVVQLGYSMQRFESWLLRGDRNPLRAMGLWHYTMFVYPASGKDTASDFATYRFHAAHERYETQIQKLRLDEAPRVVKLSGLTVPHSETPEKASEAALMKFMLFYPLRVPAVRQPVERRRSSN